MNVVDVRRTAAELPAAWGSLLLGQVGSAGVKVLRMDGRPLPPESHDAAEALLVVEGELRLVVDGVEVDVRAGEMCIVQAGVVHAVNSGSRGTLVIVEDISSASWSPTQVQAQAQAQAQSQRTAIPNGLSPAGSRRVSPLSRSTTVMPFQ
ncbi:cupin domain-containing protein [Streptomyces sp. N35]|uniref:cupin domain-containing protein n=1 Tax=Streptomyces sp. N35 TaxID=2795730 RepID=UPI0018F30916|nr:cupin domain-containing protein [Streptomyces sp. N35]